MMDRTLAEAWRWDEPELDEIILSAIAFAPSARRRRGLRMPVDAPGLANLARAAVPPLYQPHLRYRSAVAGPIPTVTVNHLSQDASGPLSPPGSRPGLGWTQGHLKPSGSENLLRYRQRLALGRPRRYRCRPLISTRPIHSRWCRRSTSDLPPMNWSTVKVSERRTCDGHQASSTRGDRREAAPG